jgi:three-Cys-motif partner protein
MNMNPEAYLLNQNDGLPMRDSGDWAKDKLWILKGYVHRFITSMRDKWPGLFYVDLLAGPGKNVFTSGEIMLGSPLIALTAPHNFTHYRFVELDENNCYALRNRVQASPQRDKVNIIQGDCNLIVSDIVKEIHSVERNHGTLNMAFLDPEGLELRWDTVKQLGQVKRMDLIINFSTSGFTRNASKLFDYPESQIDAFFGTSDWKDIFLPIADEETSKIRRTMLDFYKRRLTDLGYTIHPDEQVFRNSRNRQLYTLIFASKHQLGNKFWRDAIREVTQPKLF